MPVFDPKYPAHIIYQCVKKGTLSLYVLAGTKREGEAIAKALSSGNEEDVERVASECGTIAVLMWRPVLADKAVVRALIYGSCSHLRIQESLDKAAKFFPFLNAPIVKSRDVLKEIPTPTTARKSIPPVGKPPHASRFNAPVPAARQRIMTAAAGRTSRQGSDGSVVVPKATVAPARALKAPLHSEHQLKDRNRLSHEKRLYRQQQAPAPPSLVRILLKEMNQLQNSPR
ncbi:hypothetical protein L3Y34_014969 [Caenorhabditis briggsae]|uniref:Uncharacterized protein n=1 Tax=Caenorhabditis briggsae TaxID=6238 RepID=A0AAE9DTT1_CAEBR|nr:hypothetical protein L3Y34_014969 [Caenorhabditis briggsae]